MNVEVRKWTSSKSYSEQLLLRSKAHPVSAWFFYATKAAAVAELSQSIFQRILPDVEYAKLVDARTGDIVRICVSHFEQSSGVFLSMIRIKLFRAVKIGVWSGIVKVEYALTHDGYTPQLLLLNFRVPPEAQKRGLATRMFAAHVQAAQNFGFKAIHAYAAGGSGSDAWDTRNGYYTAPRLGFDTKLTAADIARLPLEFKHLTSLSEVMEQPGGRAWWHEHGFALDVTFDTSPHSHSVQMLHSALAALPYKHGYWDSGQDSPLRVERGTSLRPYPGWQQRMWKYRQTTQSGSALGVSHCTIGESSA